MTTTTPNTASKARERIRLPDGRTLSYTLYGQTGERWVVVLDGPGSRGLARAAAPGAEELGIRLLAPDRPGFGESDVPEGSGIAGWPADLSALLEELGIEKTGIVTQSGGTPTASRPPRLCPIG